MSRDKYNYTILPGRDCAPDLRDELRGLFGAHYGVWSKAAPEALAGKRITFGRAQLDRLLDPQNSFVLIARHSDDLVGYAIGSHVVVEQGTISWVTQLVVHGDHRNRGIARKLMGCVWCFSDDFAWGLATANPYAVRALETATLRRCDPVMIEQNLPVLAPLLPKIAHYLAGPITASDAGARIDTAFPVSHEDSDAALASVTSLEQPWLLGDLGAEDEWLAVTFREQDPRPLTLVDLDRLTDASGSVVADAYERMAAGAAAQPHPWMGHGAHEIDALIHHLKLAQGAEILDLGCGSGRHALELAARGYKVTAIDRSERWLAELRARAVKTCQPITIIRGDARNLELGRSFDGVICLYDVIGSFANDTDNLAILKTIHRHLKLGGKFALSVMNRLIAERSATLTANVRANPSIVHRIRASHTMQNSGAIWNPDYFLADPTSGLIYRRERFDATGTLPVELLVCDRRFFPHELEAMCETVGLQVTRILPVALGRWDEILDAADRRAKELLCLGSC